MPQVRDQMGQHWVHDSAVRSSLPERTGEYYCRVCGHVFYDITATLFYRPIGGAKTDE